MSTLGFANPAIYPIASGNHYASDFHDITQGTNLYYSAGPGYDNATGWGSFNGTNLLADLSGSAVYPSVYLTATAGNNSATLSWTLNSVGDSYTFTIYRATTQPSPGEALGGSPTTLSNVSSTTNGTSSTTYTGTDSGLTNGTTYYYQVVATNSTDNSSVLSNVVSATPNGSSGSGHTGGKSHKK